MLSRAQNTFHHNPRLRGPVFSVKKVLKKHVRIRMKAVGPDLHPLENHIQVI